MAHVHVVRDGPFVSHALLVRDKTCGGVALERQITVMCYSYMCEYGLQVSCT